MRLVGSQEERLSRLQAKEVEEENAETADIAREVMVQAEQEGSLQGGERS